MKKLLAAGALLLAGLLAFFALRPGPAPADDSPAPVAEINTIQLVRRTVPVHVRAFGSIVAGPAAATITLAAPGIVVSVQVRPGQAVAAGQILAHIAPDPQSVADLRKAEDAMQATQAARAHVAALLASHLATAADLAASVQAENDAASGLAALRALGTGVSRTVTAPFAGIVTTVTAMPGGASPAGAPLFGLAAPNGLVAVAGLPEAAARQIQPGDAAMLTALNTGTRLRAIVMQRAAMLDPHTGLVDVTLAPQGAMPLGEPVALTVTAGSVTGDPVPRDAVLQDAQGDYVFQLDAHGIAHREAVRVLEADGATSVLAPDLDVAMPLVTAGAYQLEDGMETAVQGHGP
jgi:RND family efflux transporter MFP subunit